MKVETKYSVGDVFYQPRSYQRHRWIKKMIDGEEWSREEWYFEPVVKEIRISRILIDTYKNDPQIRYFCDHRKESNGDWEYENLRSYTDEMLDRAILTYGRAMEIANDYAIHKKKEYFG